MDTPQQPDPASPPRHAVLLTWLGGRMHDRGLTPERLRRVGVLAAQIGVAAMRAGRALSRRVALLTSCGRTPGPPAAPRD